MSSHLFDRSGTPHEYLTPREFARLHKVTERTVYNWMVAGMPHLTLGDEVSSFKMILRVEGAEWARENAGRRGRSATRGRRR